MCVCVCVRVLEKGVSRNRHSPSLRFHTCAHINSPEHMHVVPGAPPLDAHRTRRVALLAGRSTPVTKSRPGTVPGKGPVEGTPDL